MMNVFRSVAVSCSRAFPRSFSLASLSLHAMASVALHLVLKWRIEHQLPHLPEEDLGVLEVMRLVRGEGQDVTALLLASRGQVVEVMEARMWLQQALIFYQSRCMSRLREALLEARDERDRARDDLQEEQALTALFRAERAERDRALSRGLL